MKKTLAILFALLFPFFQFSDNQLFAQVADETLIFYWSFNEADTEESLLTSSFSVTDPQIINAVLMGSGAITSGTGEDFTGENAQFGDPAGSHLRFNNPIGSEFIIPLPTTGFEGVVLKYETRRSGSGANQQIISYTTDGESFTEFETIGITTTPTLITFDFSGIEEANNNEDFAVKIEFNDTNDPPNMAGNNRFDNVTLHGSSLGLINLPPVVEEPIGFQQLIAGGSVFSIDLNDVFSDPDDDELTFTAESLRENIADAEIDGSLLIVGGLMQGETTITVFADDGVNEPVPTSFRVLVHPEAHLLADGAFTFNEWDENEPEMTFPSNMIFLQSDISDPVLATPLLFAYFIPENDYASGDSGNIGFPYRNASRTRINGLGEDGIQFVNTGRGRDVGAAVAAINTTGIEEATISFLAGTNMQNSRIYAIRLLYRTGLDGEFQPVLDGEGDPVEYSVNANGHVKMFESIALPADALDEDYVQLKWKYYYISGSGARPWLRLDDIMVNEVVVDESPTTLSFLNINNGNQVLAGQPFSASVQLLNDDGLPALAEEDIQITLSLETGTGSLTGNLSGTVETGHTSVAIEGILYDTAETGVSLRAQAAGLEDAISEGFSVALLLFDVSLAVEPLGAGTLEGAGSYGPGADVTVMATANPGFLFENWMMDGDAVSFNPEYTFTMPEDDVSLTANFSLMERESLVHFFFFGNDIFNNTPLTTLTSTFSANEEASIDFHSALDGYPFDDTHPDWRRASMERRNAPTPLNYRPEGNSGQEYGDVTMRAIQIKQPFTGDGGENTMFFNLPMDGFENALFSFAVLDEGAADALILDYSVSNADPVWITDGLPQTEFPITGDWQIVALDFSGIESVDDNPDFIVRVRFTGDDMAADDGDRVTFNNVALDADPIVVIVPGPFSLIAPPDGTLVTVDPDDGSEILVSWGDSENAEHYRWLAVPEGGSFENPLLSLDADDGGTATTLTLIASDIDAILSGFGLMPGEEINLLWTVEAQAGFNTVLADQAFHITLARDENIIEPIIITQWTFDNTIDPSIGEGFASLIGGITQHSATLSNGWRMTNFPDQFVGSGTAGAQFMVGTSGFSDINLSFQHRSSGTMSRWAEIQYTTDGGDTWLVLANNDGALTPHDEVYDFNFGFIGLEDVENNPDFGVRVVSIFSPVEFNPEVPNETFPPNTAYHRARTPGTGGGAYSGEGNWRLLNVTFTGVPVDGPPEPEPFSLISPPDGTVVETSPDDNTPVEVTWEASENAQIYAFILFPEGGEVEDALAVIPSGSSGTATSLTLTLGEIDALLADNGIERGEGITLLWTVRASVGELSRLAEEPFGITLNRSEDPIPPDAEIITQWTFDDTIEPEIGEGSAMLIGGTTQHSATASSGWRITDFPDQFEGSGTAGAQFMVGTSGYSHIILTYEHRSSGTMSRWAEIQYTTDEGQTWNVFGNNDGALTPHDVEYPFLFDLSEVEGAENNAGFGIRVVSIFSPVEFNPEVPDETFAPNTAYHRARTPGTGGNEYAGTGNWRLLDVTFLGVPIDPADIVAAPVFDPEPGDFDAPVLLSMTSATEGASIYYTLDGSLPNQNSTLYTEPILLETSVTVRSIAAADGFANSSVTTGTFNVQLPDVRDVSFSVDMTVQAAQGNFTPATRNVYLRGEFNDWGLTLMNLTDAQLVYEITIPVEGEAGSEVEYKFYHATPGDAEGGTWEQFGDDPFLNRSFELGEANELQTLPTVYFNDDEPGEPALIQLIHNAADPSIAEVDVYVDGMLMFDGVGFRTATEFIPVFSEVTFNIAIVESGGNPEDAFFNTDLMFGAGESYHVIASGVVDTGDFASNPDGESTAFSVDAISGARLFADDGDKVEFRVFHGSTDAPSVDVGILGGPVVINGLGYKDMTGYFDVNEDTYYLEIFAAGTTNRLFVFEADLTGMEGETVLLMASGFVDPSQNQSGAAFTLLAVLADGSVAELRNATSAGDDNAEIPLEVELAQNYPNPFNPTTNIRYGLPEAANVRIDVFNITGQLVATLVDGNQNAGWHTITFDASRLGSGIYLYRIQTGNSVQTRKMILVK